jgi:N-acetylmuramoyl-L-alanine amidase
MQGNKFQGNKIQGNKLQGNKFQENKIQGNKFQGNKFQGNKIQGNKLQAKQFHAKHFNLANKWNPNVPKVKFKAGYKIQNSWKWKGPKYVVFKNYHSQWHDKSWWGHHYNHVVFVFGGWYYWDGGYYYPAWGYAPDAYYAYDGPIYTGSVEMDPGQVVANAQTALQEQGYYTGEVDGILGPLTRAALAQYQEASGLEPTGAIDEPTVESLGLA